MRELQFFAASDVGVIRQINQDSVGAVFPLDSNPESGLFVVCDGMGAHKAGEVASRLVVDTILQNYLTFVPESEAITALKQSVQLAHEKVLTLASTHKEMSDMGTTVVAAVTDHNKIYIANVGDSRAYLLHNNNFQQLTTDHSQVNELVQMGMLDKREQKNAHRNALSRSISALRSTVQIDMFEERFLEGDQLLLCSDGLWGQVPDLTIKNVMSRHPVDQAVNRLVKLANKAGGRDNVTVVIVYKGQPMAETWKLLPWLFEHPIMLAALVGLLVAVLSLLIIAVWLFGLQSR